MRVVATEKRAPLVPVVFADNLDARAGDVGTNLIDALVIPELLRRRLL